MRTFIAVAGFIVLAVVFQLTPVVAQAEEWECTFNFEEAEHGWSVIEGEEGQWESGEGFITGFNYEAQIRELYIEFTFTTTTVTSITMTYDADTAPEGTNPCCQRPRAIQGFAGLTGVISQSETIVYGTAQPYGWTGSQTIDRVALLLTPSNLAGPGDIGGSARLYLVEMAGEGVSPCAPLEFVKPIRSSDLDNEWNTIETYAAGYLNAQKTMLMYSNDTGAKVHSPTAGTVTNVHKMQLGDCYSYFFSPGVLIVPLVCSISIHTSGFFLPGTWATTPVQVVTIEGDNGYRFVYFVKNADQYITEGQHVEADCWIGETFKLETVGIGAGIGPFSVGAEGPNAGGVTMWSLQMGAVPQDGVDFFTIEANGTGPCNRPAGYEQCLGDAPLNIASEWDVGGAIWNEPGIVLQPGGYIRQTMNLLSTLNPKMSVMAQSIGGASANFSMQLGTTVQTATATPAAAEYQIPPDEHAADLGGLYTVKVRNTSSVNIKLTYVCVQNTTDEGGTPDDPPPDGPPDTPNDTDNVCTFDNNSFSDSTTGWYVTSTDVGPGEIRVQDGGTITQNISAAADTYTLTVVASVWSYNSFVPDDTDTADVTIEWDFPADTTYDGSGVKTLGQYADNNNLVVYQITVVIASDTTGDFTIRLDLASVPTDVRGIAIRSVCLVSSTSGGGEGGDGPGDDGPFEVSCSGSTAPAGNSFGAWTGWLWGKFRSFFSCELMVLLNQMYTLMQKSYTLFGWSIRYNQAVSVGAMQWVSVQLLPWLGGHLSNIAVGQVTTISSADECSNIFCLIKAIVDASSSAFSGILDILSQLVDPDSPFWQIIDDLLENLFNLLLFIAEALINILNKILDFLINLINAIVSLLGTILLAIINLIILAIIKALEIFNLMRLVISVIVGAWIAAPVEAFPAFPTCAIDQEPPPLCLVYWVLDHTVFSSYGQYFMTVIAIGMWLNLLTWIMRRVNKALIDLGMTS